MEVLIKSLLHQQVKICWCFIWKHVPTAISGGVNISEVSKCNLLQQVRSQ